MIKILLIEDHALVRAGMRQILQQSKGMQVVGEAGTGTEGIEKVRGLKPDVVLLDLKLPDYDGLEITQKLLQLNSELKILIVSSITNDLLPFRLLEAGAQGYLTKDATPVELIEAIKGVYQSQRIISPQIASHLALAKIDYKADNIFSDLSEREMEVMMMVIRCVAVKDIATSLQLSEKTIHSYRSRIFEKLNVKSDLALTLLAIRHNLITLD